MADPRFDGRVALVTGGSGGIGAALSRALSRHGATVAISYGELTGGAPTQAELGARWNRTT